MVALAPIGSLGIKMLKLKSTSIVMEKPIRYNTDQVQPVGQVFCGHLCLYVLKELSAGHEFQNILNIFF